MTTTSSPSPTNDHVVPCRHWSASSRPGVGICAVGAYVEPSRGVCLRICRQYDGPTRSIPIQSRDVPSFPVTLSSSIASSAIHPQMPSTRPALTPGRVASFARAVLTGKYVGQEIVDERIGICSSCEYRRTEPGQTDNHDAGTFCGLCGCTLARESKKITSLAAYEENLPTWGCKHPGRVEGRGWRR